MDHVEKESVGDLLVRNYIYERIFSVHECFRTVNLKAVELGFAF
jgi:hypothetical protein